MKQDHSIRMQEDYSNLRERQSFYIVSVPGETAWYKEVWLMLSFFPPTLIRSDVYACLS